MPEEKHSFMCVACGAEESFADPDVMATARDKHALVCQGAK